MEKMTVFGPDDQLTAIQAGQEAGVHPRTIIAWIRNGWLDAVKRPGRRGKYLVRYEDLVRVANQRYIARRGHEDKEDRDGES